jgi:16S rRNA G1207 methylase RsmC
MFTASLRGLKVRGQLVIVGNRHLNYHGKLKKLFGNCETIASNAKFVVLRATKLR